CRRGRYCQSKSARKGKSVHARKIALLGQCASAPWSCSLPGRHACGTSPAGEGVMPNFKIGRGCAGVVCGIAGGGRGPRPGPVGAAAVILDPRRFPKALRDGLDDSKVLSIEEREACYRSLRRCVTRGAAYIGVGAASVQEIDHINILRAALLAMARAVA